MKKIAATFLAVALLCSGCATAFAEQPAETRPPERSSKAAVVAKGTAMGALKGAGVCATPMAIGLVLGPVGVLVGGVIALYCLPFGVTLGAIAGAANAAFPGDPAAPAGTGVPPASDQIAG